MSTQVACMSFILNLMAELAALLWRVFRHILATVGIFSRTLWLQ